MGEERTVSLWPSSAMFTVTFLSVSPMEEFAVFLSAVWPGWTVVFLPCICANEPVINLSRTGFLNLAGEEHA